MVRPRADNYEERKQEILDAAASMFAEQGFGGASISAIARRCGVSKALLYHYFESKEELLYCMLHSHCTLLLSTAEAAIADEKEPATRLEKLVKRLMGLYTSSRDKHIVLLNDLNSLSIHQQAEIRSLEKRLVQIIKDILAELRPDLDEPVRTSLAMYFMGAINWTYTWFNPKGSVSANQYADLATTVFLNGVYGDNLSLNQI